MIFEFTPTERDEFNPDTALTESHDAMTPEMAEERISLILEAWGWTEDKRDELDDLGERVNAEAWERDVEAAYFIAVNSPSGTPTAVFAQLMEARGWPRNAYGINA